MAYISRSEDVWEVAISKRYCICFSEQWLSCKSCISPSLATSWAGTGSTEPRVRQVTVQPLRGEGSRPACSCALWKPVSVHGPLLWSRVGQPLQGIFLWDHPLQRFNLGQDSLFHDCINSLHTTLLSFPRQAFCTARHSEVEYVMFWMLV